MSASTWQALLGTAPGRVVLSGPILPFELWRVIFLDIFLSIQWSEEHLPPDLDVRQPFPIPSELQSRLYVFKNLWVSKYWYYMARDVFYEDLNLESAHALHGAVQSVRNTRHLGTVVRRTVLSFPVFRDTGSEPPKSRAYKVHPKLSTDDPKYQAVASEVARLNFSPGRYRPSSTQQRTHWQRWQGFCSEILQQFTSLQDVKIIFTSDWHAQNATRSAHNYSSLFGGPNLANEAILHGLRACSNLRQLYLVDPSPLDEFGPSLHTWSRLHSVRIKLSNGFTETSKLPDTAFCPPRDLEELHIHDHSDGTHAWPLQSDIANCVDLKVLDLGVTSLRQPNTVMAFGFLIHAYQSTLTELSLHRFASRIGSEQNTFTSFADIFASFAMKPPYQRLSFPQLERLRIKAHEPVEIFSYFDARCLSRIEVDVLTGRPPQHLIDEGEEQPKKYWKRQLSVPALGEVKLLAIGGLGMRDIGSFRDVCQEIGIELQLQDRWNATMGLADNMDD